MVTEALPKFNFLSGLLTGRLGPFDLIVFLLSFPCESGPLELASCCLQTKVAAAVIETSLNSCAGEHGGVATNICQNDPMPTDPFNLSGGL